MTVFRSGLYAWQRWSGQTLDDRDQTRDRRELLLLLAAAIFVFVNAIAYSLVQTASVTWSHLYAPLTWLAVVIIAHLTLGWLRPRRDPFLLPIFAFLSGWGLLLQDRLAPNFLGRQTLWFALATMALLLVAVLPRTLQPLMRYRYSLLVAGMLLLSITLVFGVNPSGSGAALWLPLSFPFLGTVYFQPSELLKLLLVVFLASYFTELEPLYHYRKQAARDNGKDSTKEAAFRRHLPFLGPLLIMWGFTLILLVWQQDLGAAALFFIVFIAMLYLATGERAYTLSGAILLIIAGIIAFFAFDTVVAPRVLSWLNPWPNVSDRAYQIVQALYAQAAGGIIGQGIGQGYPDFIPVVHSDFVLAAISEEWGLIGSLTIVGCFAVLALRGLRAATLSIVGARPSFFNAYVAGGLVALLTVQTFLIMGGVTRLLPLTGITLPFVSYGGSSMLVSSLAIGLLIFISAEPDSASPLKSADPRLSRRIEQLGLALLVGFSVVALTLTYWSTVRSDALLAREDNPRAIEAERRVQRGRILDRNDFVLADTVGAIDSRSRVYPLPESGPAVGYYSLRFGRAGIEATYDAHLRGQNQNFWSDAMRRLIHEPRVGTDIRLTLDAALQKQATDSMIAANVTGGLVLLELTEIGGEPVAEIRAMVSQPAYDPNLIDTEFEQLAAGQPGPLVNRATQAQYQPGLVTQPLITAAALDSGLISLDATLEEPFLPVTIDGQVLRCAQPRVEGDASHYTWADMANLRCPAPLQALGNKIGTPTLEDIFRRFGLDQAPDLPLPAAVNGAPILNPGLAAIGQDTLTLTPLQVALAIGALAGDGRLPGPRLVESLAGADGRWEPQPAGQPPAGTASVSPEVAAAVRASWPVANGASIFANIVLAGPGDSRNAWFLGIAPEGNPRFVLALVLEGETDTSTAEEIGGELLLSAMTSAVNE